MTPLERYKQGHKELQEAQARINLGYPRIARQLWDEQETCAHRLEKSKEPPCDLLPPDWQEAAHRMGGYLKCVLCGAIDRESHGEWRKRGEAFIQWALSEKKRPSVTEDDHGV